MTSCRKVAVIGGGVAGLTLAAELARRGVDVFIVEKEAEAGGWATKFSCKATDKCQHCLACRGEQIKATANQNPHIKWLYQSKVTSFQRIDNGFKLEVLQTGVTNNLLVEAVILAVGFTPFIPDRRGEFGYRRYLRVLTGIDLEEFLTAGGRWPGLELGLQRIGFVQCVGSRDTVLGNGYCSQVCCQTAVRQAIVLRTFYPEAELNIFYLDLQGAVEDVNLTRQRCQEAGINLVRGIPSQVYNLPNGRLGLKLERELLANVVSEPYDLIVLSCAMVPRIGLKELSQLFDWPLNDHGFLMNQTNQETNLNFQGPTPGIFAVGACRGPRNISQSIAEGQAGAAQVLRWLGN